jgi:hypothetical protein
METTSLNSNARSSAYVAFLCWNRGEMGWNELNAALETTGLDRETLSELSMKAAQWVDDNLRGR